MFVDYIGLPERPVRGLMGYFLSKIKQVMKNIKSIKLPTSVTHLTLNKSQASESIPWLCFKLCNAHISVHYLDIEHFTKTNSYFG